MKEHILKNKISEVVSNKTFSEWEVGLDIDEENKIISISLLNDYSKYGTIIITVDYKNIENREISLSVTPMNIDVSLDRLYTVLIDYLSRNNKKIYEIDLSKNKIDIEPDKWFKVVKSILHKKYRGGISVNKDSIIITVEKYFCSRSFYIDMSLLNDTLKINYTLPYDKKISYYIQAEVESIIETFSDLMLIEKMNPINDISPEYCISANIKKEAFYKNEIGSLDKFDEYGYVIPYHNSNLYKIEDGKINVILDEDMSLGAALHEIIELKDMWEYNEKTRREDGDE